MVPMEVVELVAKLLRLILEAVGEEKAKTLLTQEGINRANAEADAVEAAKGLT